MTKYEVLKKKLDKAINKNKELEDKLLRNIEINRINHNMLHQQKDKIDKLSNMYESQLSIQDKEIKRLNTIIHYLESKCLKVYE